jgi:glycosyltransferase involved in cell wall biosynthesis
MLAWESRYSIACGGLAEHVSGLAAALAGIGHEVHVLTRPAAGQERYSCIEGVHYHRCAFEAHDDFPTYIDRMCASFVDRLVEAEAFYGRPFDVVHGHDWLAAHALARIKRDLGRPIVLTMHSTEFGRCGNQLCDGMSRRIRDVEWEGTYVADRVICVSQRLIDEVAAIYQVPRSKMQAVYNGVDVRRFDLELDSEVARQRWSIGFNEPLVLFVGRLAWQKGPDILLEAAPEVLKHERDAKFLFVGDGDMRSGLEGRASSLGLFDSVRFAGHRGGAELVGLFKAADVVCVPSRNEPFGIVVLEAWGAQQPVVATRNGGPAEFVRHHDNGLLVNDDKDSIAWGIGTALADRVRSKDWGRAGRREAEERFTWEQIADETARLYETCAVSRASGS